MGQTYAAVTLKEEDLSNIQDYTWYAVPTRGPYTAATDGRGAENRPDFWNVLGSDFRGLSRGQE